MCIHIDNKLFEATIDKKDAYKKYKAQAYSAKSRGIDFLLTFEEWLTWWTATGKWFERGNKSDQYVMARLNDCGAYSLDNIKCIQVKDNIKEVRDNIQKLDYGYKQLYSNITPYQFDGEQHYHPKGYKVNPVNVHLDDCVQKVAMTKQEINKRYYEKTKADKPKKILLTDEEKREKERLKKSKQRAKQKLEAA